MCHSNEQLETHHKEEQYKADANGFIRHFHKNTKFNLMVLCHKCHAKITKNMTIIKQ